QRHRLERRRLVRAEAGDDFRWRSRRTGLHAAMTLLSSLRGRIFLASALLAVLSIGVAIYLVNVRVTNEADGALQREILSTATVGPSPRAAKRVADQPAVGEALGGRERVSLLPQPDGILQVVTVPIAIGLTQPQVLGTLSVGFLLDDVFASQLKEITGSDIAF